VEGALSRLRQARVGRLATTGGTGEVHLVPVCFAVVDDAIVSAVDHKPKTTTNLRRLRDIEATGRASLLVDHYEDDWSELWWVRVSGPAAVHRDDEAIATAARSALAAKYRQYAERPPAGPVWSLTMARITAWSARD
jgi:PPOX class probable F420-dependent enzyme